jgi:hypothetical protein
LSEERTVSLAPEIKIAEQRLSALELAKAMGNVSAACKQRGMEVPVKTSGGELGVDESHPKFAEMVPPFTPVDREQDYRVAWRFFEERMGKEG